MNFEPHQREFKVFSGPLSPENTLGSLAEEVSCFVSDQKVTARSLGVEYLESKRKLVLTLGYSRQPADFGVEVQALPLGKIENLMIAADDFSLLEQAMSEASAQVGNILCHELCIAAGNECLMVLMTRQTL